MTRKKTNQPANLNESPSSPTAPATKGASGRAARLIR